MFGPTAADSTSDNKRGLLDAPLNTALPASASSRSRTSAPPAQQPVTAHAAKEIQSPLEDNLLGDDQETQEEGSKGGGGPGQREAEGEGGELLTTETTRGARLAVEDVSVVTPTGACRLCTAEGSRKYEEA